MPNEEYALVLDYLQAGRPNSYKNEPIAQVLGTTFFTLLEVVPKRSLKALDQVYVGKEQRADIEFIKRRISFKDLTSTASLELEHAIEVIVQQNEGKFVDFYNLARPITIKRHQLELLPGLGKKHMFEILKEREKKPFASFADIEERVKLMPSARKAIVRRIIEEIEGQDIRHYMFSRAPARQPEQGFHRRSFSP